jgi:hypothetical protein
VPNFRISVLASAALLAVSLALGCGGTGSISTASISVAIGSITSSNMIGGATQTFSATVYNDSSNAGVNWSASVGSINASGVYTAPQPVASTSTATITATSKADGSKFSSVIIALVPVTITLNPANPTAMASGASQPFSATVANDSASAGVTWSVTGGGSFSAAATQSGVPTVYTAPNPALAATATVTATSKTDPTKTASATISLITISVNPIVPASISLGSGGSQTFTASVLNDPANAGVTWSIGAGPGTLSASTYTSVTYTAPGTPIQNATSVTLTATSKTDPTKSTTATITLSQISVALTPTAPAAMVDGSTQAFTATVANDGANAGVTWTVTGGGSISPTSTASGAAATYTAPTPVAAASATITAISKTDPTRSASVSVPLTPISISLTTASTIALDGDGVQAVNIGAAITGDGTASGATFAVSGGGTLNASSATGNSPATTYTTPVVHAATTATVTVASVKDPSKTQAVSITLNPAMNFTTAQGALAAANVSAPYAGATILVAGGTGTQTFAITSGSLPAGLAISAAGVISGTPTGSTGTSTFTVHVVDQSASAASINGTFSITVGGAALAWSSPGASTQTSTVGAPITPISLAATGGNGAITYSVKSGTLPQGLQIVGSQITGTPTAPTAIAGNAVTFQARDSSTPTPATVTSSTVTFIANPVTLAITSSALPAGATANAYSYQLASSGGTGTITWSLTAGSLTGTGLSLSSTGLLSGTPTVAESGLSLTFQAQDSAINQQQINTVTLSLTISGPLTITTGSSLPIATPGSAYSQTLSAAGGTGAGYTWSVTSGATGSLSLATLNLSVSSAGVITGTPSAAGFAFFTVQVKDSANNTATASFTISTAPTLSLPTPNPASLGAATITAAYTGSIVASGGLSGYTWTVNGTAVPTNGSGVTLTDGLSVSNNGGTALTVSGTPSSTGTVTFTASVKDSTGTIAGPYSYTVSVFPYYIVGGIVNSQVGCTVGGLNGVTVSINTNPVQTTTTSANGSFSFANVPTGTYTITPSISGSSSAFYPATQTVVVTSNNLSAVSFTATLGYSVSGTVAYTGTQSGQIYLTLNPTGDCGGRSPGTSISLITDPTGAYTIRGVPPGNYILQAFLDNIGDGVPNASNPTGSTTGVDPTTANVSGVNVALSDPAPVTLTTAPTITAATGFSLGAMIQYKPIISNGVETATYYTLQWSYYPDFSVIAGNKRFFANGTHSNIWFLHGLTNGNSVYFRAYGTSGGTAVGPYSATVGPVFVSAPTLGNIVSGNVSFAATPTGPLYVGFYDQSSAAFYGQYFPSPASAQAYTIMVPTGSNYLFLAVLDQNNDGAINTNDITNTGNGTQQPTIAISGNTANENLTLPSANGIASVTTQNSQQLSTTAITQNYSVIFQVNGLIKQPVAASLVSGPNLITPVDIAICGGPGSSCTQGFQIYFNLYGTSPLPGDSYVFNITYSDGTQGTLNASVTAVLNAFPTNLSPQTGFGVSTTPNFTWSDPASASNYTYQFFMNDPNGNTIWQVPASNSTSNGFSSATTSLAWGVDPTGSGSVPKVTNLTLGTTYLWQITVLDSNGNAAGTQVQYQP